VPGLYQSAVLSKFCGEFSRSGRRLWEPMCLRQRSQPSNEAAAHYASEGIKSTRGTSNDHNADHNVLPTHRASWCSSFPAEVREVPSYVNA
jgi:hypothetical protein